MRDDKILVLVHYDNQWGETKVLGAFTSPGEAGKRLARESVRIQKETGAFPEWEESRDSMVIILGADVLELVETKLEG